MSIAARARLGRYEIRGPLGAGGMGEVYRARDDRLDRDVAIKVLQAEATEDAGRLRRFEKEARAASSLNHPNIVTIYEIELSGSTSFIVMELVEGKTLRELVSAGPLPVRRLLGIAVQVADGLARAHSSGIVHRDLKPENVMVTKEGLVKILDFGLAKLAPAKDDEGQPVGSATLTEATRPGLVMGTVGYMSPEQASGHPVDFRSDQFSLGSILYELATGKQPFKRGTAAQTLAAIIENEPEPVSSLNSNVPAPVRWIMDRCLSKEPKQRYASTDDLARDLATLRDGLSEITSGVSIGAATKRAGPIRRQVLARAAVALFATAATLFLVRRPSTNPSPMRRVSLVVPEIEWLAPISPDGQRIVYRGLADGRSALWLRELADDRARPLPETDDAYGPFWSPDSQTIAFFNNPAGGELQLKRIGIKDTSAVVLCSATVASTAEGTWGNDDVILFGTTNGPLYRVSAAGGRPAPVTHLEASRKEIAHRFPTFLPDGRHFLFVTQSKGDRFLGLQAASLDAPEPTHIGQVESNVAYAPPGYLLSVTANRTLVAQPFDVDNLRVTGRRIPLAEKLQVWARWSPFSVSLNGVVAYRDWLEVDAKKFVWLDRSGKELETFGEPRDYRDFRLSSDGTRLAATALDPRTAETQNLWSHDLVRNMMTRLTFGSPAWVDARPVWSPDGSRIAFSSNRNGIYDLYVKAVQGAATETPELESKSDKFVNDWSPDGRFLLYVSFSEGKKRLWALPMTGEPKPLRLTQASFNEKYGRFSPDGKLIAYTSDESGTDQVYVRTFPQASARWQVSTDGGVAPIWRKDGRELYFASPDEHVMSVAIETRPTFSAGKPRPLFRIRGPHVVAEGEYDAEPDGQRFLFLYDEQENKEVSTIKLIFNWLPEK